MNKKPRISLLVCDLDNTLYDWVTYFAVAFYEMVDVAVEILDVPRERLLDDLQEVHRRYHNSEQPFALLEARCVTEHFAGEPREQLARHFDAAFHAFNSARKRTLRAYPRVPETLATIREAGVGIVGHTEATVVNAELRLHKLGLTEFIQKLYAVEHQGEHPAESGPMVHERVEHVRTLRLHERKPDPRVLLEICDDAGVSPSASLYVGDSLSRDIGMAKEALVHSAWAKYGTMYEQASWDRLVRITHWTNEDVRRANEIRERYGNVHPDITLESSFAEVLDHVVFDGDQHSGS